MIEAAGDVLGLAVAAAISPFPIIGMVVMLTTPGGRRNGGLFLVGWVVGLALAGAVGLTVAGAGGAGDDGDPSRAADVGRLALGVGLLALAGRQWAKRPAPGEEAAMPGWMATVDQLAPVKVAGLGLGLAAVNPKNLLLSLAAASSIAATGLPGAEQVGAYALFAALATVGVAVPLVIALTVGDRAGTVLGALKAWLAQHNAAIMTVLLLVIGANVIGKAIAGW